MAEIAPFRAALASCDTRPALYRYQQIFASSELNRPSIIRKSIVANVRLHPFADNVIFSYRPVAGETTAVRDQWTPMFAMYPDPSGETDRLCSAAERGIPVVDKIDTSGTRHRLFRLDDEEKIGAIRRVMAPLALYIDNPDQYLAMLNSGGDRVGLMFLANLYYPGLALQPVHRLLYNLDGFSPEELLAGAKAYFSIHRVEHGAVHGSFLRNVLAQHSAGHDASFATVWPFEDDAFILSAKPGALWQLAAAANRIHGTDLQLPPPLTTLSITALQLLVHTILGIHPDSESAHIRYIAATQTALDTIGNHQGLACFILNPPTPNQIQAVANAHHYLPAHTLHLHPPLPSGVIADIDMIP